MHTLAMGLALVVGLTPAAGYVPAHTAELERYQAIVDKAPASYPAAVDSRELVAGGVPPSAMPACGNAQPVGGWDVRDLVASGTSATEDSVVRKRNIRLSEPCFDGVPGTEEALLYIPVRATELAVPMLDENDDGQDDGPPTPGGDGGPRVYNGTSYVEYVGVTTNSAGTAYVTCWKANANFAVGRFDETGGLTGTAYNPGGSYNPRCAETFGGVASNYAAVFNGVTYPTPPVGYGFYTGSWPNGSWLAHSSDTWMGSLGTDYYGGTQGAQFVVGAGEDMVPSDENTVISCATTYDGPGTITYEWSSTEKWVSVDGPPKIVDGVATAWSARENVGITDATFTSSDCPFLVSIELWVCAYTDYGPANYGCTQVTWDAVKYREHGSYGDDETPAEVICRLYPQDPSCYDVLNPPYIDGTSWDQTCGSDFPELAWGNWDWLPQVVGHLATCLFVPKNGFDRGGWIETAATNGVLGDVAELAAAGRDSFGFSAGCGVLVQDDQTGLDLNTCNWSSWAGDIRGIIALILTCGFGLWALNFIIRMIVGIPNRETPMPTGDAK